MVDRDDEPPKDEEWAHLQTGELYLVRSNPVPDGRPFFQGDVFRDVPVSFIETKPDGSVSAGFDMRTVMLMPHPCSCYKGDDLRPRLTVATVHPVAQDKKITSVDWKTLDKFPLPEVRDGRDGIADIGELATVATDSLPLSKRVACLSLTGVAWLHKRILKYATRRNWVMKHLETELTTQWEDVEVWEVWMRVTGTPKGYEAWKESVVTIQGAGDVRPVDVIPGRTAHLIAHLHGEPPPE